MTSTLKSLANNNMSFTPSGKLIIFTTSIKFPIGEGVAWESFENWLLARWYDFKTIAY